MCINCSWFKTSLKVNYVHMYIITYLSKATKLHHIIISYFMDQLIMQLIMCKYIATTLFCALLIICNAVCYEALYSLYPIYIIKFRLSMFY